MAPLTKKLCFSTEGPKVQYIDFISDDDCNNVWFSAEDYVRIRTNNSKTTKKFRKDLQSQPNLDPRTLPYCVRGLEHTFGQRFMERRNRILESVCLVLNEQAESPVGLNGDCSTIAEKYAHAAASAKELATSLGLHDEEAVATNDLMDEAGLSEEEQRAALSQGFWVSTNTKQEEKTSSLRAKRRRSSEKKIKGFGVSLKNFARKITPTRAA